MLQEQYSGLKQIQENAQMSERVEQISKAELITRIRSERQDLETTLAQLNEDQLIQPGVEGEWSVKDIVAHITTWEKRMIRWVNETISGEIPEMPSPGMTWDDLDRLNRQTYFENRDIPLAKVLAEFHQTFQEALKVVEATSEEHLIDKDQFSWREGNPLWKMVAANTWWHYKMHNQSIRDGLARSKKT
jgi:hypothetical protein